MRVLFQLMSNIELGDHDPQQRETGAEERESVFALQSE